MNTGLRLIDHDFHFISHDDADEHAEWLEADSCHPLLAQFIRNIPTGEKSVLRFTATGRLELKMGALEFDVDLPAYFASREQLDTFLGFLEPGGEATLTKEVWTAKKYNEWLQFKAYRGEGEVYPETCPKCGCLMGCSSERYSRAKNNWRRVRCSNESCGNVWARDEFVDAFRPKNQKKLAAMLADDIQNHAHDVVIIDASGVPIQKPFPWHDASEDQCRECGGARGPWRVVRSSRITSVLYACQRCFGSANFMHTGLFLDDEEIRARIEQARKERDELARRTEPC
jgi:hypothetical protein